MQHLFSAPGLAALRDTLARRPLLAFDFDGTLAPIVARHADARMPLPVARRLRALAQALPVAIVSGRSVADIESRLDFAPRYIVGNHGAEHPFAVRDPGASEALEPVRERLRTHARALVLAGVSVEDKQHSIALHYRLAPDREAAYRQITALMQGLPSDVRVFGGKMVVNLAAARAPDKAQAVLALVQQAGAAAAVFVGDDLNDEPVFVSAPASWLTVRVGRDDASSQAMFGLDHFQEVAGMLDHMLALVRG
ncbi:MAG: trehalose-phosphatase [Rhodoferax sp.]|nr:trehalose-phosphatase [Rhodoferax sp.]